MKKIMLCSLTAFMLLIFFPTQSKAVTKSITLSVAPANTVEAVQAHVLLTRLDQINAMDKSTLSFSEKRILRKEVRSIKSQLSDMGGGVYLSVGAILLIALLLIILL